MNTYNLLPLSIGCAAALISGPAAAQYINNNGLGQQSATGQSALGSNEDPFKGINLGGRLIELLIRGKILQRDDASGASTQQLDSNSSHVEASKILPYGGPYKPGTIIVNPSKKIVYKVINDDLMEVYYDRTIISGIAGR